MSIETKFKIHERLAIQRTKGWNRKLRYEDVIVVDGAANRTLAVP